MKVTVSRFVKVAAVLALAALTMTGCGQKKSPPVSGYDLSAQANQKFLTDNALKHGVIRMPNGLQYRIIKSGNGKRVTSNGDLVTVTYRGALIDGKVFDQTPPGKTASFQAGG